MLIKHHVRPLDYRTSGIFLIPQHCGAVRLRDLTADMKKVATEERRRGRQKGEGRAGPTTTTCGGVGIATRGRRVADQLHQKHHWCVSLRSACHGSTPCGVSSDSAPSDSAHRPTDGIDLTHLRTAGWASPPYQRQPTRLGYLPRCFLTASTVDPTVATVCLNFSWLIPNLSAQYFKSDSL